MNLALKEYEYILLGKTVDKYPIEPLISTQNSNHLELNNFNVQAAPLSFFEDPGAQRDELIYWRWLSF